MTTSLGSLLTRKNRDIWSDPEHWKGLCPRLRISKDDDCVDRPIRATLSGICSTSDALSRRERLIGDGYALVDSLREDNTKDSSGKDDGVDAVIHKLAEAITSLHKNHSLPATFALLFDETWELAREGHQVLSASTHESNKFCFDILAWYVDPKERMAGFSPHRDRQPDVAKDTFFGDGQAKYVTLWLALSDATPENSCLYVIPKGSDPGYTDGDDANGESENEGNEADPLQRALNSKESYQNIRALPRRAGQAVLFTHRIMHWGSRGNAENDKVTPRIAISFVSSDPSFESPYINPSYFAGATIPPFQIRLLLCCAQLVIYHQRFDVPKESIRACYEFLKEKEGELDSSYRKKVYVEFIKAMKEEKEPPRSDEGKTSAFVDKGSRAVPTSGEEEGEEDEAVLEEMLNAETGGYGGDFQDDFDDVNEDGCQGCTKDFDGDGDSPNEDSDEGEQGACLLFRKRRIGGDAARSTEKKQK